MPDNNVVLLNKVLEERQKARIKPLPEDEAFELFACEQVLFDRELSTDEVIAGIIGGANDGGIDGVYVFLGDALLDDDSEVFDEDFNPSKIATGTTLTLHLIQAKRSSSFSETVFDKVSDSTKRLLDLSSDEDDLLQLYSPLVVDRTGLFRRALSALAARHPAVETVFSYVTKGRTDEIHTKVQIKANSLANQLREVMTGAAASVNFVGASELWEMSTSVPSYTLELVYQENATSGVSHVALVSLRDYMKFLCDDTGNLRRHIFDLNVRDYQGAVEVNNEIRDSLADSSPEAPEFWWLNNGVTVVCSKTSIVGKRYMLDDVQIVNGLQTSHTIYRFLKDAPSDHPAFQRAVLVRVLATGDDPVVRDRVIRATNRQNPVPAASLRATDPIQRNIEHFFASHGWYYDRRKNYYRNIGKSPELIVGIPYLAQAIMAMGLSRPDNSRARPSTLLKRDDDYLTLFNDTLPLNVYLWAAKSQKTVDSFLHTDDASASAQERTNFKFHLSMLAAARIRGGMISQPSQLSRLAEEDVDISGANLVECLEALRGAFAKFGEAGDPPDKIAKRTDFVEYLISTVLPPLRTAEEASGERELAGE